MLKTVYIKYLEKVLLLYSESDLKSIELNHLLGLILPVELPVANIFIFIFSFLSDISYLLLFNKQTQTLAD